MTIEELGQKTKSKYPQYAQIPDAELGQKVLTKYPVYQSQITTDNQLKKPTGVLNFLMGGALKTTNDISAGISQKQSGVNESQQAALDMQSKLAAMARNANPEAQRRLNAVSGDISQTVGQGAQQQASQYSEDINANPLLRGLDSAAGIVGTADVGYQGVKAITKIPKASLDLIKTMAKKVNVRSTFGNARDIAVKSSTAKTDTNILIKAAQDYVEINPEAASILEKQSPSILKATNPEQLLSRMKMWGNAYTQAQKVGKSSRAGLFDALYKAGTQEMERIAPEVAKYTDKLALTYEIPSVAGKWLRRIAMTAGGIAGAKYIFSGGGNR
jgi:hypothetical protein